MEEFCCIYVLDVYLCEQNKTFVYTKLFKIKYFPSWIDKQKYPFFKLKLLVEKFGH